MNTTPTHTTLVQLWLETHFKGIPCAVFFDPLGEDGNRISLFIDKLGIQCGTGMGAIINSSVFILPLDNPNSIVNGLAQEEWGFVMAWDGVKFTTENT